VFTDPKLIPSGGDQIDVHYGGAAPLQYRFGHY
jgi:hypothetical protein